MVPIQEQVNIIWISFVSLYSKYTTIYSVHFGGNAHISGTCHVSATARLLRLYNHGGCQDCVNIHDSIVLMAW